MLKAFISHSSKDKPFVRKLKEDLLFNEIQTWLDEDELKVGDKLYDSLMLGLQGSSHFLIVLSNNIKGSEWIKAEIDEAVSSLDKKIIKKIIPILLRKTEIPIAFKDLFRADFSSIIFTLAGEKVSFTGDTYQKEVEKIVRSITSSDEYTLSNTEKLTIVKDTDKFSFKEKSNNIVGFYQIVGFESTESKYSYVDSLKSRYKNTLLSRIPTKIVSPVVLPSLLKPLFGNLILGEKIYFPVGGPERLEGHFCGYSENNSRIIVPSKIRKAFGIATKVIVQLRVDGEQREITFID